MKEKEYIITGIKLSEQMERAKDILESTVIPKENLFQKRKRENKLSQELKNALKVNA